MSDFTHYNLNKKTPYMIKKIGNMILQELLDESKFETKTKGTGLKKQGCMINDEPLGLIETSQSIHPFSCYKSF